MNLFKQKVIIIKERDEKPEKISYYDSFYVLCSYPGTNLCFDFEFTKKSCET